MSDCIGSIDGPTHLKAVQRIAELEAENKELRTLHGDGADDETIAKVIEQRDRIAELVAQLAEAQKDAERLLVLATKWCDRTHHDWEEIFKLAAKESVA